MFSQAPNNPQDCIHFHSLKTVVFRKEWPPCSSWPTCSQAWFPSWGLSPGFLYLVEGWPLSKLLPTFIMGVSPGHLLQTCSSPILSQKELGNRQHLCPANCTHRFSSTTCGLTFETDGEKKSIKINFIHENYRIPVFSLSQVSLVSK